MSIKVCRGTINVGLTRSKTGLGICCSMLLKKERNPLQRGYTLVTEIRLKRPI